jgi:hypothetical protein
MKLLGVHDLLRHMQAEHLTAVVTEIDPKLCVINL